MANGPEKLLKEISGTKKFKVDSFHIKTKIKETEITKSCKIGNEFNSFLTGIGQNLASSIANATKIFKDFKDYLIPSENNLKLYELGIEEFETAFNLLKRNKAAGDDDINVNIVPSVYN